MDRVKEEDDGMSLIDRQAAIDALISEGRSVDSRYISAERIIHESDAIEAISMLPSAEPVIIRCKDCKHRDADDFCTGRGYPNVLVPDDGFCDKGAKGEKMEMEVTE